MGLVNLIGAYLRWFMRLCKTDLSDEIKGHTKPMFFDDEPDHESGYNDNTYTENYFIAGFFALILFIWIELIL